MSSVSDRSASLAGPARWLLIFSLWLAPAIANALDAADTIDPIAIGRRIYRDGVLPSGEPLQGIGAAGVTLRGAEAACAVCHRRSGYGSSEGSVEVRPITAASLFGERVSPLAAPSQAVLNDVPMPVGLSAAETARANAGVLRAVRAAAWAGNRPRPRYDDESLARAIRDGVDITGHMMAASMPRYALDATALAPLTAYLKTLSIESSAGVTADTVHFATVIQPNVDSTRRDALIQMLDTYLRDRNLSRRAERRREQSGQIHLNRTYREWILHVWQLKGASDTWARQLDSFASEQPVFALLSGLGDASWQPIHEFSERHELPCIFPQTDLPASDEPGFYTVYLSRGIELEAQALAKYLRNHGEHAPVIQVFRSGGVGAAGAGAFERAWLSVSGVPAVNSVVVPTSQSAPDTAFWQRLATQAPGATFVLWLAPADLAHAQSLTTSESAAKSVYLSASLGVNEQTGFGTAATRSFRLVYPQDLPSVRAARLAGVKQWMRNNGVAMIDERLQMNAYLAATATGMIVSHSVDAYSREFLLERLEHRLGTALEPSIYPHLSLGPGQRFASKGSYVVESIDAGNGERQLVPLSEWIVP